MADHTIVSLQAALDSLPRRPGLVLGPDATTVPGAINDLIIKALKPYDGLPELTGSIGSPRTALDDLRQTNPPKFVALLEEIRKRINALQPSLDLPYLAKAGWSLCISLTEDVVFEALLRDYYDSLPASISVTIVDHPSVSPPDRTISIYKLLGNIANSEAGHDLALAESDLLVRQQLWPSILRTCADYLREGPLLFVGTGSVIPLARNLLSTLLTMQKPNINRLLFLRDDPTLSDPTVKALCKQRATLQIDASLREFCAALAEHRIKATTGFNRGLSLPTSGVLERILGQYQSAVSVVPDRKPDGFDASRHMSMLIDGLFRPSAVDWNPYLFGLDLQRSVTASIKEAVAEMLGTAPAGYVRYIVVRGEAGVGKTSVLKRVAVELASEGIHVLWCRRSHSGGSIRQFRNLVYDLSEIVKKDQAKNDRFLVLCDDPWALKLDPGDLMLPFDKAPFKVAFIFALRNSDYFTADGHYLSLSAKPQDEFEIPFELDDKELTGLVDMLQRIGAARDKTDAERAVRGIPGRHASDILCSLWYLVPETQSQLAESLRDEYSRLGSMAESIGNFAQQVSNTSAVARRAYECVTVTSALDIGLPVEVLVRTLRVGYDEWLDMIVDGRPLWGLIYDEHDDEGRTIVYRTRNEVVTKVLLNLVNGGVGNEGEFRILKDLIRACDVGTPVYRDFVIDLLVRGRNRLEKRLNYQQGLELFDLARQTLPYSDRVVEHHRGIWIHRAGKEYRLAYAQFERALESPIYPGSERDAPQEHIHTSMAASVVQMIKQGEQDRAKGLVVVKEHLRQASSPTFFNPHTAHVAANLLLELAQKEGVRPTDKIRLESLSEALQEIERALQMIGARGRTHFRFERDIAMLTDLQGRVLKAIPELDELKKIADEQFEESGNQIGFEAAARKMLGEAISSGKGRAYNQVKEYIEACVKKIQAAEKPVSPELLITRIDLMIRWQVHRMSGLVDWEQLRDDLHAVISVPRYGDNVMKLFYYAVALFHTGDMTGANAVFARLRRAQSLNFMAGEVRCYFLGKEGFPKRLQCTLERQHGRYYAGISELNTSVLVRTPPAEGGPGSTAHTYIGFALNGPVAVFIRPEEEQALLP